MRTTNQHVALLLCSLLTACASMAAAAPTPARFSDGILTDLAGMTLYVFDKDAPASGKSTCNGPCATNWPPLMVKEGDKPMGDYSLITRDDGKLQWAFKGKPLYYWVKDQKPGDKTGDGVNKIWHIVTP